MTLKCFLDLLECTERSIVYFSFVDLYDNKTYEERVEHDGKSSLES